MDNHDDVLNIAKANNAPRSYYRGIDKTDGTTSVTYSWRLIFSIMTYTHA